MSIYQDAFTNARDADGIPDDIVDAEPTNANLRDAILNWTQDTKELFIYMAGHGGIGNFRMSRTEILRISDMDTWLDTIQENETCVQNDTCVEKIVLFYESCHSGSFIPLLAPPPDGKERIQLSSTPSDQKALIAVMGFQSFSSVFWSSMNIGISFYDSFVNAKQSIELIRGQCDDSKPDLKCQTPQLDANGNGIPNEEGTDIAGAEAQKIEFGAKAYGTLSDIPTIVGVSLQSDILVDNAHSTLIYAKGVIALDGIDSVRAIITPPNYSDDLDDDTFLSFPVIELTHVGYNRYEAWYINFTAKGEYKIAVYASDKDGDISFPPKQLTLTQTRDIIPKGDVTGDHMIDLRDVIIALKVLTGMDAEPIRSSYADSGVDVNGDGKIGLEEAVYILKAMAGTDRRSR